MLLFEEAFMPKALSITGLAVSLLLLVVFGLDLALGIPFGRGPVLTMDIGLVIATLILAYLSWSTFREQK